MPTAQEQIIKEYPKNLVLKSTEDHAKVLSKILRQADLRETHALGISNPFKALCKGIHNECYTVWNKELDKPIAMFGVGPSVYEEHGCVWMMGSDHLVNIRNEFLRHCREWLDVLLSKYSMVHNIIDTRNKVHIKWLEYLGFTFGHDFLFNGYNFRQFWKVRENV